MNSDTLRIGAVLVAIIALILLVTRFRLHPFVTLIVVSIFLGLSCGLPPVEVIKHFEKGFGDVMSYVGIVQADTMVNKELMVPATGAGSLILSHVNDAGSGWSKSIFN